MLQKWRSERNYARAKVEHKYAKKRTEQMEDAEKESFPNPGKKPPSFRLEKLNKLRPHKKARIRIVQKDVETPGVYKDICHGPVEIKGRLKVQEKGEEGKQNFGRGHTGKVLRQKT